MKYIIFHIVTYKSNKSYDLTSKNDLFCQVQYNNNDYTTKVIHDLNEPIWNEIIVSPYNDTCNLFSISIYDKDALYSKELVLKKTYFISQDSQEKYIRCKDDGFDFFYTISELDPINKYKDRFESIENSYIQKIKHLKNQNNDLHCKINKQNTMIQQIHSILEKNI